MLLTIFQYSFLFLCKLSENSGDFTGNYLHLPNKIAENDTLWALYIILMALPLFTIVKLKCTLM